MITLLTIMATYCIGDVQGCFDELQHLLDIINYNKNLDQLWFAGDLVNRGPKSLETLRFIKNLPNTKIVLGNHDLHLLCLYYNMVNFHAEHLEPILSAPDAPELIAWLRRQKLIYYDKNFNAVLVHAGIYPKWTLAEALEYAYEFESALSGPNYLEFLQHLYGNQPDIWQNNLQNWDRLRFITNACTRMRFCSLAGQLEFASADKADTAPDNFLPWFRIPWRKNQEIKILFGHWAALNGITNEPNVFALDTGCVWGNSLTAMRLEDGALFSVRSHSAIS